MKEETVLYSTERRRQNVRPLVEDETYFRRAVDYDDWLHIDDR